MLNFDYLKQYEMLAPLYRFCNIAERNQLISPQLSALNARLALEWMAKEIHKMKGHVPDEREGIYDLVADPIFTEFINDDRVMMGVHYVRKIGNNAAHTGNVSKREAFFTLLNLYNFVGAVLMKLRVIDTLPEFGSVGLRPADSQEESCKPEAYDPDESEAETRRLYIDTMLEEAGWEVVQTEGSKVAAKACIEVEIPGMPNPSGVGYADYILFGRDLKPLAVIEAKRTSVDPHVGKQQAILYADCLERQYGVRPAIYYTNGFETHFIDGIGYPPRRVYAFHTREDLEIIMKKRDRKDITDIVVDEKISGRYYQIMAVKKMCEWLNAKHRRGLLVMATGTGKTRTAISLVDVLQKAGWVKNTLFLADRTSLVSQAQKAFDKLLPQTTTTILNESKPNMDARIMFSTYQTMIKKVNTDEKPFSVGRFDLIIIDEAHRSVFGKFGAIFNYFDSFLVGLTATPRDQVDKSTYDLLELDGGEPNFAYEYRQAQEDKFLVPYRGFQRGSAVVNQGIKYDDLTPEEQKQLEDIWEYEEALNGTGNGPQPRDVESPEIYKYIFNIDTVDKVLQDLMENGLKVDGGEKYSSA
ncbi:MAG: DEAD/DEAH box helicase family protein [Muribaculum sp.]|nr:DEAD/DEAH box helicase family protein [Muribaculum sp.]